MGKNYVRIDDRLIHGQICTAWAGAWDIKEIIAIDDKLAVNKMLQSIMLMGIPSHIKAHIVTMEEGLKLLEQPSELNRLFVSRFTQDLARFGELLKKCELVNIGNAAKKPDSTHNFSKEGGSVFFVNGEDVRLLDELTAKDIRVLYQTMPNSSGKDWETLRKSIK